MGRRLLVVLILGISLRSSPAYAATYRPADEAKMQQVVNAERAKRGLPTMQVLDSLVQLARQHSVEMNQKQTLFHNLNLGDSIRALGLHPSWHGENVVVAPNIDLANNAFLNSPKHLENIIRPNYNAFGVGVVPDSEGVIWVTQVFAEIKGLSGAAPAPRPPVAPPPTAPPPPPPSAPPATPAPKPKPKPTVTPTPKPAAPIVVEGGIVGATEVPLKTAKQKWSWLDYLPATTVLSMMLTVPFIRKNKRRRPA